MKKPTSMLLAAALAAAGCERVAPASETSASASTGTPVAAIDLVTRGDYLVRTTGCNDCHTAGYAEQQGNVDAPDQTPSPPYFELVVPTAATMPSAPSQG